MEAVAKSTLTLHLAGVSADGTTTEPVAATLAEEHHSAWGPDGNAIIYDSAPASGGDNQVYVVTRAGRGKAWGTPRRLTYFTIVVRRATWAMELAWK